ncbi:hypothetical protein [Parasporobacterium paucivorans]|uniref:Uncharacterized protein n=1 Tax=Parasporobacterium paucivorans DSM 15970 TaxID=1122934 RepID=A0A1M6HXJ7_9FIRM|nr:hypothetical protein [Parasporobacterium paucivorans]SHJ26949.1 hypothetical protein SAMN02745691_01640 [Parasporobacterium paucivorans DSM 15970]
MYKYMKDHEEYIKNCLKSKDEQDFGALLNYHKTQIEFMQHERFVHLIITLVFAFFMIAFYVASMMIDLRGLVVIALIFSVVELFYIVHYYRLENGVQRWYRLYKEIYDAIQMR